MYTNFDRNMTLKHHVEIRGWPLRVLCCPSDIKSRVEVELVIRGFETGTTYWKHLDGSEWNLWLSAYNSRTDIATLTGTPGTPPELPAGGQLHVQVDIPAYPATPRSSDDGYASVPSLTSTDSPLVPSSTTSSAPSSIVSSPPKPGSVLPTIDTVAVPAATVTSQSISAAPVEPTAGDKRPALAIAPSTEGPRKQARSAAAPFTTFLHYGVEGALVSVKTTTRKPRTKSDKTASSKTTTSTQKKSVKGKDRASVIMSGVSAAMSSAAGPSSSTA